MTDASASAGRRTRSAALRSTLLLLVQLGAVGVCAASLLGHLGRHGILFELVSHFRVQYAALLVCACAILLSLRSFKSALLVGVVAVTDLVAIAPYVIPGRPVESAGATSSVAPVRLLTQNVNTANGRYADVLALIAAERPDIVLLLEVDPDWMEQMRPLDAEYPYACASPRTDNFGIALWSRFELLDTRIEPMTEARVPTIITDVAAPGGRLRFIGTHPLPPVSSAYVELRNEQLALIAAEVAMRRDTPAIVAGDLNTTPWSSAFAHLLRDSGLRDTAPGFGLQRTWPASMWLMRIPIDHVLATGHISATARRVGPDVGSDHLGVIADLVLDPQR